MKGKCRPSPGPSLGQGSVLIGGEIEICLLVLFVFVCAYVYVCVFKRKGYFIAIKDT